MEEKKRCSKRVSDGTFRGSLCRKPFAVTEEGRDWCKIHAPSAMKVKLEARRALWALDEKRRDAKWDVERAEQAVLGVAKGWASDPKDEMNTRALKTAVDTLLAAENRAKELS